MMIELYERIFQNLLHFIKQFKHSIFNTTFAVYCFYESANLQNNLPHPGVTVPNIHIFDSPGQ